MPDDTPVAQDPAVSAPALSFSITANIDPGRQIVFQSFVPLEASEADQKKALNRALDLADHAEQRYTIKGLKIALASTEESLRKNTEAAVSQQEKIGKLIDGYEREHEANGRRGAHELKGIQKTNVDNAQITLTNQKQTITNLTEQVAKTKEKIAELEALAK